MAALILSAMFLFIAALAGGFAAGWWFRAQTLGMRREALERDVTAFRAALSEAQVRRARGP